MPVQNSAPKRRRPEIKKTIREYFADNNIKTKIDLSYYEEKKGKRIDVLLKECKPELFNLWKTQPIRMTCTNVLRENDQITPNLGNDVDVEEEFELNNCPLFNVDLEVQETIPEPTIISAVQEQAQEISSDLEEKEEPVAKTFDEFVDENKVLKKSLRKLCHRIDELTGVVQRLTDSPTKLPSVEIVVMVEFEKDTQLDKTRQIISAVLIIICIFCNL